MSESAVYSAYRAHCVCSARGVRVNEFLRVGEGSGGLVPVGLVVWMLDCSRQNVYQLCDSGALERRNVAGSVFVTMASVLRHARNRG